MFDRKPLFPPETPSGQGREDDSPKPENAFARWVGRLSEKQWLLAQRLAGGALGLAAAALIFLPGQEKTDSLISLPTLLALVLALTVPAAAEKQGGRAANQCRYFIAIGVAAGLIAFVIYNLATGGFSA